MSTIIRDSGKPYAVIADAAQNMWSAISGVGLTSTGVRYPTDNQCFTGPNVSSNCGMTAISSTNDGTVFLFVANNFNQTFGTTAGDFIWQGMDGVNIQFTILFSHTAGSILVYSGDTSGTLLTTFTTAYSQTQWNGWNVKVVVHNTAGEVHIRKNGSSTDTFVITGVNTRGGSTNNYANQHNVGWKFAGGTLNGWLFQDVWLYNSTPGNGPSDFLPNDVRTFWMSPNGASQTQFSQLGAPVNSQPSSANSGPLNTGNEIYFPFTVNSNGLVTSVAFNFDANFTGHAQLGIYDNTGAGGQPGNLLATSNVLTNPVSGIGNSFVFPSTPALVNTAKYYFGIIYDVTMGLNGATAATGCYYSVQAYASGLQNPASTLLTLSYLIPNYTITLQANNYTNVSDRVEDGTTSMVQSSTVGQTDLYTLAPLPLTPTLIMGVQVRGFMQKSDSNARSGALAVKSGSTEIDSTAVALTTTFENIVSQQDTDPATGATWTPGGLNNALLGPKCAA